jgi:hypothetical protein
MTHTYIIAPNLTPKSLYFPNLYCCEFTFANPIPNSSSLIQVVPFMNSSLANSFPESHWEACYCPQHYTPLGQAACPQAAG